MRKYDWPDVCAGSFLIPVLANAIPAIKLLVASLVATLSSFFQIFPRNTQKIREHIRKCVYSAL